MLAKTKETIKLRDITWQMFELTGDIDAYLLYRAFDEPEDDSGIVPDFDSNARDDESPNP